MSNSQTSKNSDVASEIAKLTTLGQVAFVFAVALSIAVLISSIIVAGISYFQFVSRPNRLLRVTKNLKERMAKYVLKEESLNEFATLIGTTATAVHDDRKTECPDVEDLIDTEIVGKTVDPFKAPSNRYEIGTEKDDDLRTCYGMDQDVFAKDAVVSPSMDKPIPPKRGTASDPSKPPTSEKPRKETTEDFHSA